MNSAERVWALLKKDVLFEWRNKTAIAGWLVYVTVTTFIIYLSFRGKLSNPAWMSLYWIVVIFSLLNTSTILFKKEYGGMFYYIRSLASPLEIFTSKALWNFVLSFITAFTASIIFSLFFGNIFLGKALLWGGLVFGGVLGLSNILTLLSALVASSNNLVLLAIIGLPVLIPLILILIQHGQMILVGMMPQAEMNNQWMILALLNVVIIFLAIILFNYIWRE
jgi:heme exporter protein B